jgi:hypothetical protein
LARRPSLTAVALPRPRGRALLAYAVPVIRSGSASMRQGSHHRGPRRASRACRCGAPASLRIDQSRDSHARGLALGTI